VGESLSSNVYSWGGSAKRDKLHQMEGLGTGGAQS